jgi:hypothetical protein
MSRSAVLRSLIAGVSVAVLITACTPENISAPQGALSTPAASVATAAASTAAAAPSLGLLGAVLQAPAELTQTVTEVVSSLLYPVVQRTQPLAHPITVTRMMPVNGGVITIPEAGLTITFSRGALLVPTPITVTADSGKAVSYEFGPHGTQFHAPVSIQQDMSVTTLAGTPSAAPRIMGAYTPNGLADIVDGLMARVAELLNATTTIVIGADGTASLGTSTFVIKHFSGYILISG